MSEAALKRAALVVALVCLAALVWLNRSVFIPEAKKPDEEAGLNPAFVACRDQRVAEVSAMRADGLIDDKQFESFKTRAMETCAGQFPPQERPAEQEQGQ